jgi:hypothetical protein
VNGVTNDLCHRSVDFSFERGRVWARSCDLLAALVQPYHHGCSV